MVERQMRESIALSQLALGGSIPSRVITHAAKLRKQVERDRRDLARIEALRATTVGPGQSATLEAFSSGRLQPMMLGSVPGRCHRSAVHSIHGT